MSDVVPKLASKLPQGVGNGLAFRASRDIEHTDDVLVAIVLYTPDKLVDKLNGTTELHYRIERIEPIDITADQMMLRSIMQSAAGRRVGQDRLPDELLEVEGLAFDRARESDYEEREAAQDDLLKHGSGVYLSHGDEASQ